MLLRNSLVKNSKKALAQASKRASSTAAAPAKPKRELAILSENKLSEEDAITYIRKSLKQAPYTSKFANKTMEDYEKEASAEFARPVYIDENFISFVSDVLGYRRDEVKMITTGEMPDIIVNPKTPLFPGDKDVDWDAFKKVFGYTSTKENYIGQIEKGFKKLRNKVADMNKQKEVDFDWKPVEQRYDPALVQAVKADFEVALSKYQPINLDAINQELEAAYQPLFEQVKDRLFEGLDTIKETSRALELETPLLKVDANGVPVCDFDKDFLDQYVPEIRDEVIEEIETDNWDVEYIDERRQVRLNLDTLLTYNAAWRQKELEKQDQAFQDEMSVAASTTEEAKMFQKMYIDVIALARKNIELENEVQSLKYALMEQEQEKAKTGEEKTEANKEEEELVQKYLMKYMSTANIKKEFPGVKQKAIPAQKVEEEHH